MRNFFVPGFFLAFFLLLTGAARGATFTVTNTSDSGAGSFRQAILDANGGGIDTINFNIPGGGVKKIAPLTELPDIIGGSVIIDATTQPGWSVGNLMIELSGENLGANTSGLRFVSVFVLSGTTPQSFVRGLAITNFQNDGVYIQDSVNITIEGCHIGVDPSGTVDRGNEVGVEIRVGGFSTNNITIGGTTAATRNVISGNNFLGIEIFGGNNYFIKGNYIGTDKSGVVALPNGVAMQVTAILTTIGGATAAERNVISGNNGRAIVLDSSQNTVRNNYIGVAADGFTPLGNGSKGIDVINSINLINIGSHLLADNVIANNKGAGIATFPGNNRPTGVRISGNSIYNNQNGFGADELGIDLEDDGVTENDAGDPDTGPNNFQNFPVLTAATVGAAGTTVTGTLNSTPNTSFRVEFFASDTNLREGKNFLGFQNVTTDAGGDAAFSATVAGFAYFGQFVTATATRNAAPLDTSEFSAPVAAQLTTFTVTNTNNSGAGSLRQAIIDANAAADPNVIEFAITPINTAVKTISPTSALPTIVNPVAINGSSQSFAACGIPKVELDGTNAGPSADGLFVTADNVLVQGLAINRFGGDGITLSTSNNSTLKCLLVGTNSGGSAIAANDNNGILVSSSNNNVVENNTISGNGLSGLRLLNADNNIIQNNIIGLDRRELSVIPNSSSGVFITGSSNNNLVGGTETGTGNTISGNAVTGLTISGATATGNFVKGNFIGVDSSGGGTVFDNGGPGVLITASAAGNDIGGTEASAGNVIGQNVGEGVWVDTTGGTGNRILGNSISGNRNLGIDLGAAGVTANDAGDPDTGANDLQNFPVVTAAESFFGGLQVTGSLNSGANTAYRVEVFSSPSCDGSGNGEGQNFIGAFDVATNTSGNASFTETFNTAVAVGQFVTATATRRFAPTDTSEFSVCRAVTSLSIPSLTVTNTNDTGAGSLRQAITDANATPAPDEIVFNIPGAGVRTINLNTSLPATTAPVVIDGLSQPGATCSAPLVEILGVGAGATAGDGLHISGSGSINGLVIGNFSGDGIEFDTVGHNIVKCSRIGTDVTGLITTGHGIGSNGIYLNEVGDNVIGGPNGDGNVIHAAGNSTFFDGDIRGLFSGNNIIQGNIIGGRANGNAGSGGRTGIILTNGTGSLIGGPTAGARNFISTVQTGVFLQNSGGNTVQGNYFGLNLAGETAGAGQNTRVGVDIDNAANNQIVGNVVSNTRGSTFSAGIEVSGSLSQNTIVKGNLIGTNAAGTTDAGNVIGISITEGSSVIVGGSAAADRNVIAGNDTEGVTIGNVSANLFTDAQIQGNYIGLAADGTTVLANGRGIHTQLNASTVIISGNVIAGNTAAGIEVETSGVQIRGNLIGTDAGGTLARGNGTGILLDSGSLGTKIGGPSTSLRNVVSGNGVGIDMPAGSTAADGSLIQNNFIGTAANGTAALGNSGNGVDLDSDNNSILSNTIAFNGSKGLVVLANSTGNRISANSIHSNTNLGIDLGNDGVTPNDPNDADLANNLQNYPVLASATATAVAGTLNSTPNTQFTLEFFLSPTADPTNFGEGQTYLGALGVTTNGAGSATFSFTTPFALPNAQFVAATATNKTTNDTSEFSQVRQVLVPTAANLGLGGRVVNETGRGIARAVVTLVGPDGVIRTTQTNPFGYYRFADLPAGQSYVLGVAHKSYDFEPSGFVLVLDEQLDDFTIAGRRRAPPDAKADEETANPTREQ
ncbi:MAG: right-handed parallel beta-helix repeat-containing protein [Acidobacteria bacterium]|nr:right-handed parallel beta-helix repeat-containing protein [Acidobacteriota bacterium]